MKTVSLEDFDKPFLHTATWNARLRTTGGRFFQLMVILILIRSFMKHLEKMFFERLFDMSFAIIIFILKVKATSIQMLILKNCCEVDGLRYAPSLAKKEQFYRYRCQKCGQEYHRKRRVNTKNTFVDDAMANYRMLT